MLKVRVSPQKNIAKYYAPNPQRRSDTKKFECININLKYEESKTSVKSVSVGTQAAAAAAQATMQSGGTEGKIKIIENNHNS